jgi:thiol:disulfide interchange protein
MKILFEEDLYFRFSHKMDLQHQYVHVFLSVLFDWLALKIFGVSPPTN